MLRAPILDLKTRFQLILKSVYICLYRKCICALEVLNVRQFFYKFGTNNPFCHSLDKFVDCNKQIIFYPPIGVYGPQGVFFETITLYILQYGVGQMLRTVVSLRLTA